MQITKKDLKKIISEEIENVANEKDEVESLIESYCTSYEVESDYVSKEALIDFLEVMSEEKIPKALFESFIKNLPEESVSPILKEALEE